MIKYLFIVFVTVCSFLYLENEKKKVNKPFINISTASMGGAYYPVGANICKYMNHNSNIRCSIETSAGSIYNANAISSNNSTLGILQSDVAYQVFNAEGVFKHKKPFKKLRSVLQLHSEALTIIVRKDSSIKVLNDWLHHRVNKGVPGTGTRGLIDTIFHYFDIKSQDFALVSDLKTSEQGSALCDRQIDVMLEGIGHPSGVVQEVNSTCKIRLVPMLESDIKQITKIHPYYSKTFIDPNVYSGKNSKFTYDKIPTIGIVAYLMSSDDISDDLIYNVVKEFLDNFQDFRSSHSIFFDFEMADVVPKDNIVPIHNGAKRAFVEYGLMKSTDD